MKNLFLRIAFLASFSLVTSCSNEYVFTLEHQKQVSFNATIPISLKEKEDKPVQKVQFFVNGKEIPSEGASIELQTKDLGVGKHQISTLIFYSEKTKKENSYFEVLANKAPIIYDYKIINDILMIKKHTLRD